MRIKEHASVIVSIVLLAVLILSVGYAVGLLMNMAAAAGY